MGYESLLNSGPIYQNTSSPYIQSKQVQEAEHLEAKGTLCKGEVRKSYLICKKVDSVFDGRVADSTGMKRA